MGILFIVLTFGTFFVLKKDQPGKIGEPLPSPRQYVSPTTKASPSVSTVSGGLPSEINLNVPFTSQAPFQDWSLPYDEFCEEASTLMAASYIKGSPIIDPADANKKLLEIKAFEEKFFGFYEDTNTEQTAMILTNYYGIKNIKVLYEPTLDDIKKSLAGGKVVLLPAAGQLLGNPYYRQPGPIYHMLVLKGYTKDGNIITNDPGTRRGENYIYDASVLMNAMHDWNNGDILSGRKAVIIVG